MRAYEVTGRDGVDGVVLVERPRPSPGPGQVLVRVRAGSLNFRDLMIAQGRYPLGLRPYPLVPLSDGAGEVVELGPGAGRRVKVGDRVASAFFQKWIDGPLDRDKSASALGGALDGVLAEYVVLEEAGAVKVPDALSFEEASTLPCAGVTVWNGLMELGRLKAGDTVLAMGTGGVSIFALQIAKAAGARVILTSSHDAKLARGKELGADATIDYQTTPDWGAAARALTGGRGVDHILEVGGAKTLPESIQATREGGSVVLVGVLSGAPGDKAAAQKNDRGVRVDSVFVGSVRHFEALNAFIAARSVRPVIDRVFPFDQVKDALRCMERGEHFGKIVVRVA